MQTRPARLNDILFLPADKKGKDGYRCNVKLRGNCYFIIVGDYVITVFLRANGTPYMQPVSSVSRRSRIAPMFGCEYYSLFHVTKLYDICKLLLNSSDSICMTKSGGPQRFLTDYEIFVLIPQASPEYSLLRGRLMSRILIYPGAGGDYGGRRFRNT